MPQRLRSARVLLLCSLGCRCGDFCRSWCSKTGTSAAAAAEIAMQLLLLLLQLVTNSPFRSLPCFACMCCAFWLGVYAYRRALRKSSSIVHEHAASCRCVAGVTIAAIILFATVVPARVATFSGNRPKINLKEVYGEQMKCLVAERNFGFFCRRFQLPPNAIDDTVSASMQDGVLFVRISTSEKAAGDKKKVSIE